MGYAAIASGLLILFSASCGSLPKTHYYMLTAPPPAPANAKGGPVLLVEPFRATEVLRDDRIIYYKSPTELGYYQYHRWGADPATLMTDLVAREARGLGIFRHVRQTAGPGHADYILRGRVFNFEEVDYEAGGKGRVGLEMELFRSSNNKVVWSAREEAVRPAGGRDVGAVVEALNDASQQLVSEMLAKMAPEVANNPAQDAPSN